MLPRNHRLILVILNLHNNKLLTRQLWTSWRVGKEPFYSYCFCACLPLRARPPSEIGEDLFAVSKPLQVSAPSAEANRRGTELCVWFTVPNSVHVLPIPFSMQKPSPTMRLFDRLSFTETAWRSVNICINDYNIKSGNDQAAVRAVPCTISSYTCTST